MRWLPAMPRGDYLALLGACDVGMAATVPGVTSFSIPSKTIDYLRVGLPVVVAIEHGNDFAAIIQRYGVGRVVPFGDARRFQEEATRLATAGDYSAAAARCLDEIFDLRHALAAIGAATAD